MEQISPASEMTAPRGGVSGRSLALRVIPSRLRLAMPADPAPEMWQAALVRLLDWSGINADFLPPAPTRRLPLIGGRGFEAPVLAPWTSWSPAAFGHGGLPGLPAADYVASYLHHHPRSGQGGADLVLLSPHPARCIAQEAGGVPVPSAAVMAAMIRAARDEGRDRIAIILHARQRNAIAAQLLAAGKALTARGPALAILTIEEALAALIRPRAPWDAIIAMPDLRGTIFTVLAETAGVRGAWPMLWHAGAMRLACCEAPGEGARRLPLDATALIQTLALVLDRSGARHAARQLHQSWARLCDTGLVTPSRGAGDAPYARIVPEDVFIAMLCEGRGASKRAQPKWRALGLPPSSSGDQGPSLRLVP